MLPNDGILCFSTMIQTHLSEEATQTEESGSSSHTDFGQIDDSSEEESVIERLSRLFSASRQDRGTQTAKDPLSCETEKLAFDIVYYNLGKRSASPSDDDIVKCLRNCVERILQNHSITFNGMMSRISLDRQTDLQQGFDEVANEIFREGQISWSRIATFFAFGARLAQFCVENQMNDMVMDVVTSMSQLAVEKLTPFLRENGGWGTLCEAFPMQSDYEGKLWRSLVFTGMGLTAIATLLALQRSSAN
eukprot:04906.XXX_102426_101393_1 [CDS] Oithona nana genome sequencing.